MRLSPRLLSLCVLLAWPLGCGDDASTASTPDGSVAGGDGGGSTPRSDGGGGTGRACAGGCGRRALCDEARGECVCIPGYEARGASCGVTAIDDPESRSVERMCEIWRGVPTAGGPAWLPSPGGGMCDPGSLPFAAHQAALARLEAYRLLSGVGPVELGPRNLAPGEQACALIQDATNNISHNPPMDWACWSAPGARAAGSSYIAWGFGSAASTVDGYIRERQSRLSHRRGLLAAGRAGIYFGHHGSGGCLHYGGSGSGRPTDPEFIAYPNPGPAPLELFGGLWSVQQGRGGASARFTARVFREDTGEEMPIRMGGSFGGFSSFTQDGWSVEAGVTYRVELEGDAGPVVYRTTPSVCR